MKKIFVALFTALLMVSCGKSYIESYEEVCNNTKEQLKMASSPAEVVELMKQFRFEINEVNEEFPKEAAKYMYVNKEDKEAYAVYQRRSNAYNMVSRMATQIRRIMINNEKK